jgi:hypothetical protein
MTIKTIDFNKLSTDAQDAFLAFVKEDQLQGHPTSVLGRIQKKTSNTWFLWAGLSILFTIISSQIVSDKDRLAQEVAMSLGNTLPFQTTSIVTVVLGVLSIILLLVGILKRFLEQKQRPSWSARIYFTDRLMIDANSTMLSLIPLSSIQSVDLQQRNIGQYGTNIFYFSTLSLNDANKTTYRLESGHSSQLDKALEEVVCQKVQALIERPVTEDIYTIDGVSLLD